MGKLSQIDKAADSKGSGMVTLWQLAKFMVVSMIATVVQFALLNALLLLPQVKAVLADPFAFWVFAYDGADGNGLGYFIAFNIANIAAQLVAFFVNREKTFNSSSNIALTLPIFLVFTVALLCFSAWLAPVIQAFLVSRWLMGNEQLAANISTMACGMVQFIAYFPLNKILFRKRKAETN
jgi:putative flippase GtrA